MRAVPVGKRTNTSWRCRPKSLLGRCNPPFVPRSRRRASADTSCQRAGSVRSWPNPSPKASARPSPCCSGTLTSAAAGVLSRARRRITSQGNVDHSISGFDARCHEDASRLGTSLNHHLKAAPVGRRTNTSWQCHPKSPPERWNPPSVARHRRTASAALPTRLRRA